MDSKMKLGLDEALVRVQVPRVGSLDILYQYNECFNCPPRMLVTLGPHDGSFKIGTKLDQMIELRQQPSDQLTMNETLCKLFNVQLSNQAEYLIKANESHHQFCVIEKTLSGPNDIQWPLYFLAFLVIVSLLESLYVKFKLPRAGRLVYQQTSSHRQSGPIVEHHPGQISATNRDGTGDLSSSSEVNSDDGDAFSAETFKTQEELRKRNSSARRLDCLDIFRGLTLIGMIMVNYGGAGYAFLEHKPWNGLTPADLVFPFFIFSMGASIAISIKSQLRQDRLQNEQVQLTNVFKKIIKRSFLLILIGLCLNSQVLAERGVTGLRLPGVLQRFGISYLVVASCYATELLVVAKMKKLDHTNCWFKLILRWMLGWLLEFILCKICTFIYIYFTFFYNYNPQECPRGYLGPGADTDHRKYLNCTGGAAGWIDRSLLGENHLYHDHEQEKVFGKICAHDPEGILGNSTSIILTLIGLLCGKTLMNKKMSLLRRSLSLARKIAMLILMSGGLIIFIPVNKNLWSLTFVTITGCIASVTLTILFVLIDLWKIHHFHLIKLAQSAGRNSLFLYIGHSLVHKMLPWWFPVDETSHGQLFIQLIWSTYVWLFIARELDKRKLYLKI